MFGSLVSGYSFRAFADDLNNQINAPVQSTPLPPVSPAMPQEPAISGQIPQFVGGPAPTPEQVRRAVAAAQAAKTGQPAPGYTGSTLGVLPAPVTTTAIPAAVATYPNATSPAPAAAATADTQTPGAIPKFLGGPAPSPEAVRRAVAEAQAAKAAQSQVPAPTPASPTAGSLGVMPVAAPAAIAAVVPAPAVSAPAPVSAAQNTVAAPVTPPPSTQPVAGQNANPASVNSPAAATAAAPPSSTQAIADLNEKPAPANPLPAPTPSADGGKNTAVLPSLVSAEPPAPTASLSKVGFTSQESTNFIRSLAGTDGVPLNVVDAARPADFQTPIHLDEAVAFALKNNFEVQAAGEKSRGAYWDKMGAYSEYVPNLQVAADTGPEKSDPAAINDQYGNRVLNNIHNRKDESLIITQPLIDLGIISDILSGTHKKDLAETDERDVAEGIALDTTSIYLSLMQSRIAIRLADNYKGYLDDLAKRMEVRVAGGGATSADLDRIRGRATAAESARIEALGEYESNLAEFKRLTHVMPAQLVIPSVLAPVVPDTMEDALKKALKDNPSYVGSLEKVDLAEDDRNKSFSGLLPKLSAQYTNSYSFNAGGAAEGNPVDGVYPTQRTQTLMLVAQWALNGGTSVTGGLSGMAKEREMRLRSLDIKARIEQGIEAGYTAINAAHDREAVLNKSVQANLRVVKSFEEQFNEGGRSLFDMLDAYEQLYNSRLNLMRVTIAEAKASYQVRRQMGEIRESILASESH